MNRHPSHLLLRVPRAVMLAVTLFGIAGLAPAPVLAADGEARTNEPAALNHASGPAHTALAVGPTPESVVRGFDGKLYVTLMGTERKPGDGDGRIVVVDGEKVTDFATGLDDPKGLVFVGGRLITTDFDKVLAFDASGRRALLAGPGAFPSPPRYLNDIAVEPGGRSILVTDMGDLAAMHSAPGVFWDLHSDQARQLKPWGRVYRISLDGTVSLVIDYDAAMPNPNGVDALEDGRILVAEFFRGTLLEWNAGQWREIATGHRSGDGIVHDASGNLYLTEVRTGRVWHVHAASGEKRLLAKLESAADLILDERDGKSQLIVPDSKAGRLVFIPASGAAASADAGSADEVEAIVSKIRLPEIPNRDYVITDFGAKPGGGADVRPAIQAAIRKAASEGGGRVIIPAGSWLSRGPIHLVSRINLHIAEGATLLFGPDAKDYLPAVPTRWEGTEMRGYSPLIYAAHVHDVAITGTGTFDGNAQSEFLTWIGRAEKDMQALRRSGVDGTPAERRVFAEGTYLRPSMIQFFHAERVLLEDYTLLNSPFWVNHLVYTDHATVRRIRVDSHHANNDGVDVDSSRQVLIEDCWFRTGDDSVVVKSGRDRDGREVGRPSEHVVVRRNDMGGEDGIALGSEMSGDVRYVYFTDNVLRRGASAIRFKANLDRGGTVEHIRVRNFTVESFENLFWFQLNYPGLLGGGHPSTYRDIVFENFTVERAGTVIDARAPAEAPLREVTLRNVTIREAGKPFILENVVNLKLDNVVIGGQRVDGELDWRHPAP